MSIPVAPVTDGLWVQVLSGRTAPAAGATAAPEGANAPADAVEEATPKQVERAVSEVNASLETRSIGLQFEIDKDTDKVIVKVVDRDSGEVIRQIPNEEVVRIAKLMSHSSGLLVSDAA